MKMAMSREMWKEISDGRWSYRDKRMNTTKYIYIKNTTVYVPSSELGLSQPLSRQRVCPSSQNRVGAHSPAGEGLGESQFRRLEKSLALCLLCE